MFYDNIEYKYGGEYGLRTTRHIEIGYLVENIVTKYQIYIKDNRKKYPKKYNLIHG